MPHYRWLVPVLLLALVLGGTGLALRAHAATPTLNQRVARAALGGYDLSWNVAAGGGSPMSSASFTLHATAGQPAIAPLGGGSYQMQSGFWAGVVAQARETLIHLPLIFRLGP